jgi:hypothetical protein
MILSLILFLEQECTSAAGFLPMFEKPAAIGCGLILSHHLPEKQ